MTAHHLLYCRMLCLALLLAPTIGCDSGSGTIGLRPTASQDEDTWAIRCLALRGPNRFTLARNYTEALKQVANLEPKLVQTIHHAGESTIYYGRYRRRYDARKDAEFYRPNNLGDLNLIRQLSLTIQDPVTGPRPVWPFQMATMDTLPTGRTTRTEWLLTNARGHYSLQVGVFYDTEQMRRRKFAAEEYCKLLRAEGREAYYHHGQINSSVCIGAFPERAIQTFKREDPLTGILHVTARIVDKDMLALQRKYPRNVHNGRIFYEITRDQRTGEKIRDPHTSFAVEIPRAQKGTDRFGE